MEIQTNLSFYPRDIPRSVPKSVGEGPGYGKLSVVRRKLRTVSRHSQGTRDSYILGDDSPSGNGSVGHIIAPNHYKAQFREGVKENNPT
jgi:hypothetical protein